MLRTSSKILFYCILFVVGIVLTFRFFLEDNPAVDDGSNMLNIGAVASNCEGCACIGGKILREGGSAADAIIATLLCEGVILPQGMGIGGGFIAIVYSREMNKVETLIARETAPAAARRDMFKDKAITGALSAGVPGEVLGYWRLHQKYGKLPWRDLFAPTIELCAKGIRVSKFLASSLEFMSHRIRAEPSLAEIFMNPATNDLFKEGEIMFRPKLAATLQTIAEHGPDVFYDGPIGQMLVEDIEEMGGIMTMEDLKNYDVRWQEPITSQLSNGRMLYTTPLPSSGPVLAFILNVMDPICHCKETVFWQRLVETFKHAYGRRSNLGDNRYEPVAEESYKQLISKNFAKDIQAQICDNETSTDMSSYGAKFMQKDSQGTANVAVLAPNGDAISITSTVNSHFGAKVRSRQTGIILNDEMDDFSTPGVTNLYGIPASPVNYIKPGKIPMSSTCPSIIFDKKGRIQLLIGGAGGAKITTAVAQCILRYFTLNETLYNAINSGRVHHQLSPMLVDLEPEVSESIKDYLLGVGHVINHLPHNKASSSVTAIGWKTSRPIPISDRRRFGSVTVVEPDEVQNCTQDRC